jgi:hypothetical protein
MTPSNAPDTEGGSDGCLLCRDSRPLLIWSVSQSREMRGSRVRGYNVSTSADRGHGSSEAGQNRQLERGPSRQADA